MQELVIREIITIVKEDQIHPTRKRHRTIILHETTTTIIIIIIMAIQTRRNSRKNLQTRRSKSEEEFVVYYKRLRMFSKIMGLNFYYVVRVILTKKHTHTHTHQKWYHHTPHSLKMWQNLIKPLLLSHFLSLLFCFLARNFIFPF